MEHALGVSIVNYSEKSFAVLILIVMEHALGDQKQKIMKAKEISVLILIVMEHALGDGELMKAVAIVAKSQSLL